MISYVLTGFIVLGVILIIAGLISIYNELTKERILVKEGFSGIGTFLQQRNDLIPNLVETVKGYAGHENKTLTDVIKWRNQSAAAHTTADQSEATQGLNNALLNFMSLTENYPELKANVNFQQLMSQLSELEEKLNMSRRYYNGTVREYNQSIAVFPKNLVAGVFGFNAEAFFAEDDGARSVPKVNFN